MKKIFLLPLVLMSTTLFAQDYLFVASYRPKGDGCYDRILKKMPVENSDQYSALRRNFYTENNASSADMWLLKPGQAAIVYEFRTKIQGFTCEYLAHGISYGNTIEEATEKMKEWVAKNPKIYISFPQVMVNWEGKTVAKEARPDEVSYAGVQVEYKTTPSRSVIAKGKNTNTDVKAVITFITKNGSVIKEITLEPGAGFTEKIDESDFDVQVLFKPAAQTSPGTLQKVKQFIKDQISTDVKGVVKHSYTGIRG